MPDNFSMTPLDAADLPEFKREMQQAFQLGYETEFFNPRHKLPSEEGKAPGNMAPEAADYFFRFGKRMKGRQD